MEEERRGESGQGDGRREEDREMREVNGGQKARTLLAVVWYGSLGRINSWMCCVVLFTGLVSLSIHCWLPKWVAGNWPGLLN